MKSIAASLDELLQSCLPPLESLSGEEAQFKPSPQRWSKKEIIGHLVDSAQNNLRRFIVAQHEENPLIVYRQDKWVNINDYQNCATSDLVKLWYFLNRQIIQVINNTSEQAAQRTCLTPALHTIEWLAADYVMHLKHHLHQILNLEPFPYS